jgi:hypothetical protein
MDNFSAHYTALELAPPPSNIRICWLPANSTSRFQPLDQGIIQSFKSHYRRQWLSYMLGCFDSDQSPLNLINIHLAIRWIVRSWNHFLTNTTIYIVFENRPLSVLLSLFQHRSTLRIFQTSTNKWQELGIYRISWQFQTSLTRQTRQR